MDDPKISSTTKRSRENILAENDLSFMILTLDGEQTVMARCHSCQIVSDEVRLRESIGMSEYVTNGSDVGRQEASTTQEATIYEGGAV
jgi:hypothetical protein